MESAIRIFMVYENRLLAEALAMVLGDFDDFVVVGTVGETRSLVEELRDNDAAILLVDSRLEKPPLPKLIRDLKDKLPALKIVVLAIDDETVAVDLVAAGANAFIPRDVSLADMLAILRAVDRDQVLCPPGLVATVFARVAELSRRREDGEWVETDESRLTPREEEVLELLGDGLRNKEIASELGITLPTVKNHVHKILRKLGVRRRRAAVHRGQELGLLEDPVVLRPRRRRG